MATVKKAAKKAVKKSTAKKAPADNKKGAVLAFGIGHNVRVPHRANAATEKEAIDLLMSKEPRGGFAKEHGVTIRYADGESKKVDF